MPCLRRGSPTMLARTRLSLGSLVALVGILGWAQPLLFRARGPPLNDFSPAPINPSTHHAPSHSLRVMSVHWAGYRREQQRPAVERHQVVPAAQSSRQWQVRQLVVYAVLCVLILPAASKDDGLARSPPMGWSPWKAYKPSTTEVDVRAAADGLLDDGLLACGYSFVGVDGGWWAGMKSGQVTRNSSGYAQVNSTLFPGGMVALSQYATERGLGFTGYGSPGEQQCSGDYGMRILALVLGTSRTRVPYSLPPRRPHAERCALFWAGVLFAS